METMCTETDIGLLVIGAAAHSLATQSSGTLTTALVSSKKLAWARPGRQGSGCTRSMDSGTSIFGVQTSFSSRRNAVCETQSFFGMPALRVLHALKAPLSAHCALSRNCFLRTPVNSAAR